MVLERQNFPPAGNFKGTADVRGIGVRLEIRSQSSASTMALRSP